MAPLHTQDVHVEIEGRVARVLLDRPPVNALAARTYRELIEVFEELGQRDLSCMVVGSALIDPFCAGADLKETQERRDEPGYTDQREDLARRLFEGLRLFPCPTVAVVEGQALGAGCVLPTVCDVRVATPDAVFRLPEIDVGLLGGARHLMRVLPQGIVRMMSFSGAPVSAQEAHRLGMIDVLAAAGEAWPVAEEFATTVAQKSPLALRLGKRALAEVEELPVDTGYVLEQQYTYRLRQSRDGQEAVDAWREGRPPRWTGS